MIIQKKLNYNNYFSNLIFSKTIAYTGFKFCLVILQTHLEGNASQIIYLCLGFFFMTKIAKYFINVVKIIF